MEKIISIEHGNFVIDGKAYCRYSGFIIKTDKQIIKLGIYDEDICCENWGYFMSNDNFNDFIGASLISLNIVDDCLMPKKLENKFYEGGTMFVSLETTAGTLQFTAYNSHNGYYSHEAVVISEQLNHREYL